MRALNTVPPILVVCAHVAPVTRCQANMTEETSDSHAPPEHSNGGIPADPTRDRHQNHHNDYSEDAYYADRALLTNRAASTRPSASRLGPLSVVDSAAATADDVPQQLTRPSKLSASRHGPLPVVDSTAAEVHEAPHQTVHHSRPRAS